MEKSVWSKDRELFRALLKQVRGESGLKQSELADKLGMHQSYVSRIENGERKVDVVELVLILENLEVKPEEFINKYITQKSTSRYI